MTKIFKNILSLLLICTFIVGTFTVYATEGATVKDEMPYLTSEKTGSYDGTVTSYFGQDAISAGIPTGYSGWVLDVTGKSNGAYPAVDFDFTSLNISIENIEKLTFRVYIPTGYSELRMTSPHTTSSWVMRATPSAYDSWVDISLYADGTGFMSGLDFSDLSTSDGKLGKFALVGRLTSGSSHYYVDSINVTYKQGATTDTTAPVITYNGPTDLTFYDGEFLTLNGFSAYDEYDAAGAVISYEWSDGATHASGALRIGQHTCRVIATDRSGNSSYITLNVTVLYDESVITLDTIPTTGYIPDVSIYDGTSTHLTASEAEANGVPQGYTGGVLKVSGSSDRFGTTLDFSSLVIPVGLIEKITMRVYFRDSSNAIRVSDHGATDWMVLAAATPNTWMEYTLTASGGGFSNNYKIKDFANDDGNLGIFGLATKTSSQDRSFYVDEIVIHLKKNDGTKPVISYNGDTNVLTSSGKPFVLDATAYDALDERYVELKYEWSNGACDSDGNLNKGEHTCRVSATNYYGNTSYIDLNVTVGDPDVEAPTIHFEARDVYVMAGTYYRCDILCSDNYDKLTVSETWSAGAIDFGGRLNIGEHTLTLTATDLSGNSTTIVVYVHVLAEDTHTGHLIVQ